MAISIDDILRIRRPALLFPFSVSSDGRWLALTMEGKTPSKSLKGVSSEVAGKAQFVYDLQNKREYTILPQTTSSWSGVWSPNKNTLAFYCDADGEAGLWVWYPDREPFRISKEVIRPFFGNESPIWTPDGLYLIVKVMPDEEVDDSIFEVFPENTSEIKEPVTAYSSVDKTESAITTVSWVNRYRADIVRIDSVTGESFQLAKGFNILGMYLSPDGSHLAFTNVSPNYIFELWVTPVLPTGYFEPKCIAKEIRMDGPSYSWLDNDTLLYSDDGILWVADITGQRSTYPLSTNESVSYHSPFEPPLALEGGDVLLVSTGRLWRYIHKFRDIVEVVPNWNREVIAILPLSQRIDDGQSVVVQTREPNEMLSGFYRVFVTSGKIELLCEEPRKHSEWFWGAATFSKSRNVNKIFYLSESTNEPPALYSVDVGTKHTIKIYDFTPDFPKDNLGTTRLIKWKIAEQTLSGVLMLPPNHINPAPVIIRVYEGLQSQNMRSFGCNFFGSAVDNHHLFTTKGYAVFLPDLPITGDEPAESITQGLDAASKALLTQPEIDSKRIGIIGHSEGGYMSLVGITRLKQFRAAVISAGYSNLISFATHFNPQALGRFHDRMESKLQCTIWENQDRYIRNSPIFEFDRIETPVVIFQGTSDPLCFAQAGPMFSALKQLGKTAELVLYQGEDHWQGTWKEENMRDYLSRVLQWFNKYILG
ncbi:dipeptidyl aminopeptidase/acylaminoacyl peptidase [Paenibacillus sp. V4I9]|uniref:S9 family peptidase n=1 Tax=Paenibacillus sp. V4I9 TaxID=3042308 RepID=UPI0027845601|nr:prolyl oligopeptidase family serine peptidase [Paenibacillus sp. V4I9]MDQ0888863.1 dipeptidyl aminopeptidase/acylaminoacyl peptidase [Paenibacillus sp. V4I9]